MELRRLGTSDLEVTPVIYGAWVIGGIFWGGADDRESIGAIQASLDSGINCIDTAPMYGCGKSEELVGKAIQGRRESVIIATKCGLRWDSKEGQPFFNVKQFGGEDRMVHRNLRPDSIRLECERSLKRLGVNTIDLYQCHWPDPTTPLEDSMAELVKLKDEGKIREIGVSNFVPEMIDTYRSIGPVASAQPKYSPLDRAIERDLLPYCREKKVGVIVYSPLERGILTGKVSMDRQFPPTDTRHNAPWYRPENRKRVLDALQRLKPTAEKHDATLSQLVIAWVFHQPGINAAIVGGRNAEQAKENAGAMKIELEDTELAEIRQVFEGLSSPK
jgi:methylglyoxal reductase